MWLKPVITLTLALVFQLAQVLPVAGAAEACLPAAPCCECCDPLDSCPCAGNDETPEKPAPLSSESGNSLKIPVAKTTGTRVTIESVAGPRTFATATTPRITGLPCGYAGVRLSVAFCSFVI